MSGPKDSSHRRFYSFNPVWLSKQALRPLTVINIALILIITTPTYATSTSLDFGWGSPIFLKMKRATKNKTNYLVWPIQISNPSGRHRFAHLDIVAVTDTGKQYSHVPDLKVSVPGDLNTLTILKSNIFPAVTRRALAVFEEVDPNATLLHFYVGGVVGGDLQDQGETRYFRITYKRSLAGWEWDGSSVLE